MPRSATQRVISPVVSSTPRAIGPHEIEGVIARTALSEVFLARTPEGEKVCVKRLLPALITQHPVAAMRFRREASLLAEIDDPHVVRVLEVGTDDGVPYLCLEYVDGMTLRQLIAKGPCSLLDAIAILSQMAAALTHIHAKRIVHGDIKPENTLIHRRDGRLHVTLVDFGLANWAGDELATSAGTLHYIAPEQSELLDWTVGPYSDLYSLGVVAFELLTAHVPFDSPDPATLLAAHVSQSPPKPSALVAHLPQPLERIVLKLLEKLPPRRYPNAASLAHDLGRMQRDIERGVPNAGFPLDTLPDESLHLSEVFVGRSDQLAKLEELLGVVRNGHPSCCFIGGPAGVGKSSLVREFRNRSLTTGAQFVTGKSHGFGCSLPYYLLGEVVSDFLQRLQKTSALEQQETLTRLRDRLGDQGPILAHLVPELATVFPSAGPVELGEGQSQARILSLFALLVESMAGGGRPLVLVFEDLQWADVSTLRLIESLSQRLDQSRLLLVATYRSEEVVDDSALASLLRTTENQLHAVHLGIESLEIDETARLVSGLFRQPSGAIPRDFLALLHERTGGNPLFVIETLTALRQAGAIRLEGGHLSASVQRFAAASLPDSVLAMILRRLRELPPSVYEILSVAAHSRGALSIPVIAEASAAAPEQVFEVIQLGIAERILFEPHPGHYRFYHDRVQEACQALVSEAEQVAIHARLLAAREQLETSHDDPDRVFMLADHAILARHSGRIWHYCSLAGQVAAARYANEQAISYLTQALEHADAAEVDSAAQRSARFELSMCMHRIGDYERATEVYEALRAEQLDAVEEARCLNGLSIIAQKTGDYERSEALSLQAAAALGLNTTFGRLLWVARLRYGWSRLKRALFGPRRANARALLRIETLTRLCYLAVNGKQTKQLAQNSFRLLTEAVVYGDSPQLINAYNIYASGLWELPRPDVAAAERVSLRAVEAAKRIGAHVETGVSMVYAGAMYLWSGRVTQALPWFENARDLLASVGERWQLGNVYIFLFRIYLALGRLDDCMAAAHALCQLGERIQAVGTLANGYQKLAAVMLLRGDIAAGTASLQRSLELAEQHNLNFELFQIYKTNAAASQRAGDHAAARRYYQAAIDLNEAPGMSFYRAYINDTYFGYAEAFLQDEAHLAATGLRSAEGARVARYIARGLGEEKAMGGHLAHGYRAKAWLLLRRQRPAASRRYFVRAIKVLQQQQRVLDLAQTYLDAARALSDRYHAEAGQWLQSACALFRKHGLAELEHASEEELAKLGYKVEEGPLRADAKTSEAMEELLNISRLLMVPSSLEVLFERIVDSSIKLLQAERALLFTRSSRDAPLALHLGKSSDGRRIAPEDAHVSRGVIERVETAGHGVAISDTAHSKALRERQSIVALGVRSVLCTPLTHDGQSYGVLYLDNQIISAVYGERELKILTSLAAQAAIALANAMRFQEIEELNQTLDRKVLERTRELETANQGLANTLHELENTTLRLTEAKRAALVQEIELARNVQTSMIPPVAPIETPAARFAGLLEPADLCGGDFWTYATMSDGLVLFVGDVVGHGLGPAMVTAMAKSCFETLYQSDQRYSTGLATLMESMSGVLHRATQAQYTMTGCAIHIDRRAGLLSYSLAGHCPPIFVSMESLELQALYGPPSSPLGVAPGECHFTTGQLRYRPGDRLLLYSDGLIECMGPSGTPFGLGRLRRALKRSATLGLDDSLRVIRDKVYRYSEATERDDDITMIIAELH